MPETTEQSKLLRSPIAARTAREGQEIEDIYGMAQPIIVDDPMLEYKAVRERVGFLDFSPLFKVDVQGPDAKRKMNTLFTPRPREARRSAALPTARFSTIAAASSTTRR